MVGASGSAIRGRVLTPDGIIDDGLVTVAGARIGEVAPAAGRAAGDMAEGRWIIPGLVDIHVHGGAGNDVMAGLSAIRRVARALAARGVTSFVPTAVSAPLEALLAFAADVAAARRDQAADRRAGASEPESEILGANLEGPAVDPAHRGAHDPAVLLSPRDLLEAWVTTPGRWDEVRIVTVAPERPGGLDFVRLLAAAGRVASVGHTGATHSEAWAAYEAGARSTTHLFNAMTGLSHRDPGAALAALLHPTVAVELIADGIHVDPAIWPLVWRMVGRRLILVSDAIPAAGGGDGDYVLGGLRVLLRDGRATLEDGTIAGSAMSLDHGLASVIAAGLPLPEASAAASATPARLLGLDRKGRIALGADADLLVISPEGRIERVMIAGRWL